MCTRLLLNGQNGPYMFKMLSLRKMTILCHASVAWRVQGVSFFICLFFGFVLVLALFLSISLNRYIWGWLVSFSQSYWGIGDGVAKCSKVAQFMFFPSQSTGWIQKRIFHLGPACKDRCIRLSFTARLQLRCNLSSNVKWEKHIKLISVLHSLRFWSHLGLSFSLPMTHNW